MPMLDETQGTSSQSSTRSTSSRNRTNEVVVIDSDDDYDDAANVIEDEDMDDLFLNPSKSSSSRRIQPLIPDDYGDEVMAAIKFSEEFTNRFGTPHPAFFPGVLSDAIKESCHQPAKDRKMLAIYLHHDSSVLSNVFCSQVLCADSVVSFLNENFVSFGWDLTFASNKQRYLSF